MPSSRFYRRAPDDQAADLLSTALNDADKAKELKEKEEKPLSVFRQALQDLEQRRVKQREEQEARKLEQQRAAELDAQKAAGGQQEAVAEQVEKAEEEQPAEGAPVAPLPAGRRFEQAPRRARGFHRERLAAGCPAGEELQPATQRHTNRFEEAMMRAQQERLRPAQPEEPSRAAVEEVTVPPPLPGEAEVATAEKAMVPTEELQTALFDVDGKVVEMRFRDGMTPFEIAQVWEKDWGVSYASRLKFKAPEGSDSKWLNAREDPMPVAPAKVGLSGIGSILAAVRLALTEHSDSPNPPPPEHPPKPRSGPRRPGSYMEVDREAWRGSNTMDNVFKRILGLGGRVMDVEDLEDDAEPAVASTAAPKGRRRGAFSQEAAELEADGDGDSRRAGGGSSSAGASFDDGGAGGASEDEDCELKEQLVDEGRSTAHYVLVLVGFTGKEADAIVKRLKLGPKRLPDLAQTQAEAEALAKEVGIVSPNQQARFVETWRRCSLHVLGPRQEYPRSLTKAAYEVDFADNALVYLETVKDCMQSESFLAVADELLADWKRRRTAPSTEEMMLEVNDVVFNKVHRYLLALHGFTPDQKGRKQAQAQIRQIGKNNSEVRELDAQLMKDSMQRFRF